jgi:hypothetical protein
MSQNNPPAVQSKDVVTRVQAISQSKEAHLSRNVHPTKCRSTPRRAAKDPVSRLPRPKVLRIQQRYITGENQSVIARAEGCDRETVSRIVKSCEMVEYLERMKEEFRGLVPDALVALRYALQVQKDARIAYDVLRDVGVVLPHQLQVQAAMASELPTVDQVTREWAMRLGMVALERATVYGSSLPDVEEPVAAKSLGAKECTNVDPAPNVALPDAGAVSDTKCRRQ